MHISPKQWVGSVACLLTLCASSVPALACSLATPPVLPIAANPSDTVPPSTPTVSVREVDRGEDGGGCGGDSNSGSCDDIAFITVHVEASDAVSPANELGYVFEGDGDVRVGNVGVPLLPDVNGNVRLYRTRDDGGDDLRVDLRVFAVDKAGNMSETPATVSLRDDGEGCRLAGQSAPGALWTAAGLLALVWRRRRLAARTLPSRWVRDAPKG